MNFVANESQEMIVTQTQTIASMLTHHFQTLTATQLLVLLPLRMVMVRPVGLLLPPLLSLPDLVLFCQLILKVLPVSGGSLVCRV